MTWRRNIPGNAPVGGFHNMSAQLRYRATQFFAVGTAMPPEEQGRRLCLTMTV